MRFKYEFLFLFNQKFCNATIIAVLQYNKSEYTLQYNKSENTFRYVKKI